MATYFDNHHSEYSARAHQPENRYVQQPFSSHSNWTGSAHSLNDGDPHRDESYELHQQLISHGTPKAVQVHQHEQSAENVHHPSFLKSIPWAGMLGLVVTVLAAIAIIVMLKTADGKATDAWPSEARAIQLSVILAILIALANSSLTLAFNEGAALAWWLKMLKGGNLDDSHRYWQHGSSAFQSIKGLRHFNKVTLVSIVMLFLIASPPLLQRAAEIITVTESEDATFKAALSQDQFSQPTGYYMTHAPSVNALTGNFSQVVQDFTNRRSIRLSLEGCNGACSGTFVTAGFDVSCTRGGEDYDMNLKIGANATIGSISISSNSINEPGVITVMTTYKADSADKGKLITTNCNLHSAQVKYPFSYTNGTIALEGASYSVDETVNRTTKLVYPGKEIVGISKLPSAFGGIAYALGSIYNSQVTVYKSAELAIMGSGPMTYTYRNFTDVELGSKSMRWIDPTPAILDAVREVTFRAAIAFSDPSAQQTVQGSQLRTVTKYKINMKFFGGTLAITLFGTLAVVVLFHGFWRLGRPVSMSPLEIATAFQAPITKGAVSMASDADNIAKQIGKREVRYRDMYLPDGTHSRAIVSDESTA
ncbi:unnamed protein product [Clonostachys byssicola]|uniref:Uncharacterized protein n=1 Tax=Clonostachys byssicola TaxID=160290 RepID=A0A9N9U6X0_9HYPO|nr:unnamed protein product [Clonostachys byssicola]